MDWVMIRGRCFLVCYVEICYVCNLHLSFVRENLNLKDKPRVKILIFFSQMVYEEIFNFPEGSLEVDVGCKPMLTPLPFNLSPYLDEKHHSSPLQN